MSGRQPGQPAHPRHPSHAGPDRQADTTKSEPRSALRPPTCRKWCGNDNLAVVAAKRARQCQQGHDANTARLEPALPGVAIGQNAAYGYSDFAGGVEGWFGEISDWSYGQARSSATGHYIQQIFHGASRIGCGAALCPNIGLKRFYFCNYATGTTGSAPFYEQGPPCEKCPDSCDSSGKLCDCQGKVCFNGGVLDINTCQCQCPSLYTGDRCETKTCPCY